GELPADGLLGLHILNNRFLDRPKIDNQNGYEIIQIGGSGEMARPSGVLIQGNTFENCNGENEILTLKTSDVFVRCNTFSGCKGVLSLRMGDRMLVQRNLFDGNGRSNTGGVGVEGAGHVIIENTFRHLRAPRNYHFWPLLMACASSEKTGDDRQGYGRVKNVLIAENYFDHNDARIAVGTYPRPEYPLLPKDIWVRNNVFIGTTASSPFDYVAPDPTGAMQKTIHESGNQFRP
ncbi:MAG: hypothetical protein FJ272_01585, partial [Planctomycetes bacterium]|nr:hypothetical protein [Planctomycetota bacterium]